MVFTAERKLRRREAWREFEWLVLCPWWVSDNRGTEQQRLGPSWGPSRALLTEVTLEEKKTVVAKDARPPCGPYIIPEHLERLHGTGLLSTCASTFSAFLWRSSPFLQSSFKEEHKLWALRAPAGNSRHDHFWQRIPGPIIGLTSCSDSPVMTQTLARIASPRFHCLWEGNAP